MSRIISPVTGKPYGLAAVCRMWRLARSGVYRHLSVLPTAQRRGPLGAMSDDALTTAIEGVLAASPFHGEGHRKIWARLRYAGIRTSMRRVLRLMRQHNLLAPTRVGAPRGQPRRHHYPQYGRHDVGHRPDGDDHRRRSGRGVCRGRSLLCRMRRHPIWPDSRLAVAGFLLRKAIGPGERLAEGKVGRGVADERLQVVMGTHRYAVFPGWNRVPLGHISQLAVDNAGHMYVFQRPVLLSSSLRRTATSPRRGMPRQSVIRMVSSSPRMTGYCWSTGTRTKF